MALNIDFRWRPAQATIDPNVRKEMPNALSTVAKSITAAKQSARTEEDRQRRIAEEERQKAAYGDAATLIKNRESRLSELRTEREAVRTKIAQLEAELNG